MCEEQEIKIMERVYLPVGNFYGTPYVEGTSYGYIIVLDDYDTAESVMISEEFYNACLKEFKK